MSSSQCKKYLKYSTRTAVDRQGQDMTCPISPPHYMTKYIICKIITWLWSGNNFHILTSHAIVGEPLTELIHNNEEDAEWVATHHFTLMDKRHGSIVFTNGGESI